MEFKDYYEILGVAPEADKKVIKQTFRQLARKYHPAVNLGRGTPEVTPVERKRDKATRRSRKSVVRDNYHGFVRVDKVG